MEFVKPLGSLHGESNLWTFMTGHLYGSRSAKEVLLPLEMTPEIEDSMRAQLKTTSKPSSFARFARAILVGLLASSLGLVGLSSARAAVPTVDLNNSYVGLNGTRIFIAFSEALNNNTLDVIDFTIEETNSGRQFKPNSAQVSNGELRLDFNSAIKTNYDIEVTYANTVTAKALKSAADPNDLVAGFTYGINNDSTVPPSTENAITAFSFEDLTPPVVGVIDPALFTVDLTVPIGTDVTNLVAYFTSSANSFVRVGAIFQETGAFANDFTQPVTYVVRAEDGVSDQNWTVTVTEEAPVKTVSVGTITANPVAGTASAPTYPVTTANIANAQAVTISWFTTVAGNVSGTAPTGITIAGSNVSSNASTLTVTAGTGAVAGNYYFKTTIDGVVSAVKTLTVDAAAPVKTVSVGTITANPVAGTASAPTYPVTTANIANAQAVTISWFTTVAGNVSGTAPTGITIAGSNVSSNASTLTVTAGTGAVAGNYYFKTTIDGVVSAVKTLTVDAAAGPASTDASLSALVLSAGTLSPTFASGTYAYTASVGNGTSLLTVTPTKSDAGASFVRYLGATGAINFTGAIAVGANIIRTIVTAADGTTILTYTVTVTRAAGTPAPPAPPAPTVDNAVVFDWAEVSRKAAADAAAAQAVVKAAADKAAADKLLAEKATADAKAAAEKAAAEKKIADEKAAAEAAAKAAAEKLAQEKVIAAEQAAVAAEKAAAEKAAANTVEIVPTAKATKISLDLADIYYGRVAYVQLVTKTKTGLRTTTLDNFVIDREDGKAVISVGKLLKGQKIQVRIGKTIVFNKTI